MAKQFLRLSLWSAVLFLFAQAPLWAQDKRSELLEETKRTAWVTLCYSAGLWCYCANQIQVRAFYAKKDTLTPVKVSATMVTLNLGLTLALVWPLRRPAPRFYPDQYWPW